MCKVIAVINQKGGVGNFVDLNGIEFSMKREKPRKETAKFKYHIPYLILSAYRVELTN